MLVGAHLEKPSPKSIRPLTFSVACRHRRVDSTRPEARDCAPRDAFLSLTHLARTASYKPRKGPALERSRTPFVVSLLSRGCPFEMHSTSFHLQPDVRARPFRKLALHLHTDSLALVRSPLAWRAPSLCEALSLFGLSASVRELHPFAIASLVLTTTRFLRASSRSEPRLAAPHGYANHDAFDRRLPIISQMRAPAPRRFRFRVEACASLTSAALDLPCEISLTICGLRIS